MQPSEYSFVYDKETCNPESTFDVWVQFIPDLRSQDGYCYSPSRNLSIVPAMNDYIPTNDIVIVIHFDQTRSYTLNRTIHINARRLLYKDLDDVLYNVDMMNRYRDLTDHEMIKSMYETISMIHLKPLTSGSIETFDSQELSETEELTDFSCDEELCDDIFDNINLDDPIDALLTEMVKTKWINISKSYIRKIDFKNVINAAKPDTMATILVSRIDEYMVRIGIPIKRPSWAPPCYSALDDADLKEMLHPGSAPVLKAVTVDDEIDGVIRAIEQACETNTNFFKIRIKTFNSQGSSLGRRLSQVCYPSRRVEVKQVIVDGYDRRKTEIMDVLKRYRDVIQQGKLHYSNGGYCVRLNKDPMW